MIISYSVGKRPGSARPAPPRVVHRSSASDLTAQYGQKRIVLCYRVSMETAVAPPTVILKRVGEGEDKKEGVPREGEEEEEDQEYMVGDSTLFPPPTSDKDILRSDTVEQQQPEGMEEVVKLKIRL